MGLSRDQQSIKKGLQKIDSHLTANEGVSYFRAGIQYRDTNKILRFSPLHIKSIRKEKKTLLVFELIPTPIFQT